MPNCWLYDKEKKLCKDYKNRPWMCVQHLILGNQYAIDTCKLLQFLQTWKNKIKDKKKAIRVANILAKSLFGASELQKKEMAKYASNSKEIDKIKNDMKKFKDAFAKEEEK